MFVDSGWEVIECERDKMPSIGIRRNETVIQMCFKDRDSRDRWVKAMGRRP